MRTKLRFKLNGSNTKHLSNSGFTLTDLLIAAGLTTAVVAAAGAGMASMIDSSTVANSKSERRVELNRSLDFISSEVRQAQSIVTDAAGAADPTDFSNAGVTGTATKVLMVNLPNAGAPVVYYIATPRNNTWAGPKVVYRWGPKFNASGDYDSIGTPSNWESVPIIDKIQESDASATAPSCPTGWTRSGTFGFSACVNSLTSINPLGTQAEVFESGKISKVLGGSQSLIASTKVGTRNTTIASTNFIPASGATVAALSVSASPSPSPSASPSASPSPSPSASPTPSVTPITLLTGELTAPSNSTMQVRVLGGAITCGAGGPSIPTSAKLLFTGGTTATQTMVTTPDTTVNKVVLPNTKLTITGTSGPYCVSISANSKTSNGSQVYTLTNGSTVPNFKPFDNQKSIGTILSSASTNPLTGKPIINSTTGKVTLAPNQAIYMYELGTTSKTSSAYDLQDLVILATVTPS
jgi:hypothetical protein